MLRLVLADDHKLVLDGIEAYLRILDPDIEIHRATTFAEAAKCLEECDAPDIVILDLDMPGMNGIEGLRVMKDRYPDVPVVILSGVKEPGRIRDALANGASGYIPKAMSGTSMMMALKLVLSGEPYVPPGALGDLNGPQVGRQSAQFESGNPLRSLTQREFDVLTCLAQGQSNKAIARSMEIMEGTVAAHLKSIFRKLAVTNRTEAATAAMKHGLAL